MSKPNMRTLAELLYAGDQICRLVGSLGKDEEIAERLTEIAGDEVLLEKFSEQLRILRGAVSAIQDAPIPAILPEERKI